MPPLIKIALVTGAATGIGRACAHALAEAGYTIALNYRSQLSAAEKVLRELPGEGHRLFQANVANADAVQSMMDEVMEAFGHLDVLVNAAGVFTNQAIVGDGQDNYDDWTAGWQQSLATNLVGPVNLAWLAARTMQSRGSGKIINITSRGAFRGEPTAPAYGAAKSALNSTSQSMAVALAPHGVHVYAIAPGWVETPQASPRISEEMIAGIPLGRVGRPEEIAALVRFLATGDTGYLTGAIFDANGASYLRN